MRMSKEDVNYLTKVILRIVGTLALSIIGFFAVKTYNKIDSIESNLNSMMITVATSGEKINYNREDIKDLKDAIKELQKKDRAEISERSRRLDALVP